jgi:2-keto-4-pentenoate hydratase/2-oxohepta-3-ene-1,7-dioic acid hydratase in catechol pathway
VRETGGTLDGGDPRPAGSGAEGRRGSIDRDAPITAFGKHPRTYARDDGAYPVAVPTPTSAEVARVIDELAPKLAERVPNAPAVMDYEGEVALVALGPIDPDALAAGTAQPLGFAACNDLTARVVQVLGDGEPNSHDYWGAAKSFARFLPVAPRVWAPTGGVTAMPILTIETRVNGDRRQYASTSELIYDLPAMLRAAAAQLGRPLVRGDVVLTGTPSGIGMRLSPLQRRVAARVTDRVRKAELLVSSYASSSSLLRPGDVIEVDCGRAGRVRARLAV